MTLGIGGAGSKLAAKLDPQATLVNVSEVELNKVQGGSRRILADIRSERGQFQGSRKSREIGHDAYEAIRRQLNEEVRGEKVFCSTGGGTGNGIASGILEELSKKEAIPVADKTFFGFILPYAKLETIDFVNNTLDFLQGPLTDAIDSGNTGNVIMISNRKKFEEEIAEDAYNAMLVHSMKTFFSIPEKNTKLRLLDGHIDGEDFALFLSKPYFNHFTYFDYDPAKSFGEQFDSHLNDLLLPPDKAIEAMFLLEVPKGGDPTIYYEILKYFADMNVTPVCSVVENPDIRRPFVTVSVLYSRKPDELVEDFNRISEEHAQAKVQKSIEQYVKLPSLKVTMEAEAAKVIQSRSDKDDLLATLRRLGKL